MKPRNTLCLSWSAYEHGALIYLSFKTNKQTNKISSPNPSHCRAGELFINYFLLWFPWKTERFTESNEIIKSAFGLTVLLALNK